MESKNARGKPSNSNDPPHAKGGASTGKITSFFNKSAAQQAKQ